MATITKTAYAGAAPSAPLFAEVVTIQLGTYASDGESVATELGIALGGEKTILGVLVLQANSVANQAKYEAKYDHENGKMIVTEQDGGGLRAEVGDTDDLSGLTFTCLVLSQ